jgi:hypothetical protein
VEPGIACQGASMQGIYSDFLADIGDFTDPQTLPQQRI